MAVIDWESKLQELCEKIGASHAGLTTLAEPITWKFYETWLENGFAGEMEYLKTHAEIKKDPTLWKPTFKSAIVVAFPYVDHPVPSEIFNSARLAMYAQGYDYHHWIKAKLSEFILELHAQFPDEKFETHTDSSPLLERDLAQKAGLGWFGKNTCLIHPKKGSLFLLGEILTTLKFEMTASPIPDFCGKCQKCMEACPTQAIEAPHVLNAAKCISYLTIESKQIPAEPLRKKMGDWFFGCDICQTVCPWNQKVFKNKLSVVPKLELALEEEKNLENDLRFLLTSSHHQILKKVKGTPLHRAGAKGLKRNALIVIANRRLMGLHSEVTTLFDDPYLGELAKWTAAQLR